MAMILPAIGIGLAAASSIASGVMASKKASQHEKNLNELSTERKGLQKDIGLGPGGMSGKANLTGIGDIGTQSTSTPGVDVGGTGINPTQGILKQPRQNFSGSGLPGMLSGGLSGL